MNHGQARLRKSTRRFGDTTAVDDVSFSVQKNTIHGLLGRNGAGKTTLMQLLTGHRVPTSGRIAHRAGMWVAVLALTLLTLPMMPSRT